MIRIDLRGAVLPATDRTNAGEKHEMSKAADISGTKTDFELRGSGGIR
jgi:hypothetical protein